MKGKSLISVIGSSEYASSVALILSSFNKFHIKIIDKTEESLSRSNIFIQNHLKSQVNQGKLDWQGFYNNLENISVSLDLGYVRSSLAILDCMDSESKEKEKVLNEVAKIEENSLICTNDLQDLNELSRKIHKGERFVGLKFGGFQEERRNVDIWRTDRTSEEYLKILGEILDGIGINYVNGRN